MPSSPKTSADALNEGRNASGASGMSGNAKRLLVPRLRFPEFQIEEGWNTEFGNMLFECISNKDHNSDLPVLAITQEQGAIPRDMIDYHVSVTDKSLESYKVVEVGDFIISLRSFQGGIEFSKYRGICSPAYVILRLRHDHCEDYFRYYLKTERFISHMTKNLEGLRDGKMISYKQFSELELPIPSPKEQKKIADCLSSLDNLLTAEIQKLDALKKYKRGLMQHLFPRDGETVPQLRFPEFQKASEWGSKKLEQLGELISGLTYSPDDVRKNGILVLRSSNVQDGRIVLGDNVYVRTDINGANPSLPNDILICVRNGSKALIGKNALIPEGMRSCTHGAFMTIFRSNSAKFMIQLFQTTVYESQVAADLGATINSINGNQLKKYTFLVPKPEEQKAIADFLTSLDDLITVQAKKIDVLKTHKRSLMQQLFPVLDEVSA